MTSRIAYNNPDTNGALGLPYHYEMLSDYRRLEPLLRAIQRVARDKRVLESGAGSGVLSILAARAGARVVYAIERDPAMARFLRQNVEASGYAEIVRVLENDTREVTLRDLDDQPVEVVIAEHLSTWQVTEPQISVMNHVNRHLAADSAVRIPECAFNCLELVHSQFRFADAVELRTLYFGFSGIRSPSVFSTPTLFRRVDFTRDNGTVIDQSIEVAANREGVVNSLRLTSPLRICGEISFQSSDSLMPPVVVPLEEDLEVKAGTVVRIHFSYRCETNWDLVNCTARWINHRCGITQPSCLPMLEEGLRVG